MHCVIEEGDANVDVLALPWRLGWTLVIHDLKVTFLKVTPQGPSVPSIEVLLFLVHGKNHTFIHTTYKVTRRAHHCIGTWGQMAKGVVVGDRSGWGEGGKTCVVE